MWNLYGIYGNTIYGIYEIYGTIHLLQKDMWNLCGSYVESMGLIHGNGKSDGKSPQKAMEYITIVYSILYL